MRIDRNDAHIARVNQIIEAILTESNARTAESKMTLIIESWRMDFRLDFTHNLHNLPENIELVITHGPCTSVRCTGPSEDFRMCAREYDSRDVENWMNKWISNNQTWPGKWLTWFPEGKNPEEESETKNLTEYTHECSR